MGNILLKLGGLILYLFITGVLWLIGLYIVSIFVDPYDADLYYEERAELKGKFLSVWRLVVGIVLVSVGVYLQVIRLPYYWLLLYAQAVIFGLLCLATCIRVRKVLYLAPTPGSGADRTVVDVNDAADSCFVYELALIAAAAYAAVAIFV